MLRRAALRVLVDARARRRLGTAAPGRKGEQVQVTFVAADGASERVKATLGSSFLQIAHDNDIEVEGACGGEMACSTVSRTQGPPCSL